MVLTAVLAHQSENLLLVLHLQEQRHLLDEIWQNSLAPLLWISLLLHV